MSSKIPQSRFPLKLGSVHPCRSIVSQATLSFFSEWQPIVQLTWKQANADSNSKAPGRDIVIKRERESSAHPDSFTGPSVNSQPSDNTRPEGNPRSLNNTCTTRSSMPELVVECRHASEPTPFPPALKTLLEAWHEVKGKELPPCRFSVRKDRNTITKAYDRQGSEVQMAEFHVTSPASYGVLVARHQDNSYKLVASLFPGTRKYGSYYRAWLGVEKGFEQEASIVRRFGTATSGEVVYRPEAWPALTELLKKDHQKTSELETGEPPLSGPRKRVATRGSPAEACAKKHQPNQRWDSSSGSGETDSSEDSDVDEDTDDSDDEKSEAKAHRKPLTLSTKNNKPPAQSTKRPELRFKLTFFKFRVQNVREFPVDECRTGQELFKKARDFFSIFDSSLQVQVLSCQIASRPDQHYIFAGSEGEFNLLVRQARDIASELGKPLTIEVGLVHS
ncbi:uncharacterized protein BJX67DRAFT_111603 [Aspergillus lucknowensis]|uniref:Uncharacterized protein n=1 Tax=Aspergillus lucknowensis TaxID=176173 RepID=A0ABR4LR74_9EURO